MPEFEVAAVALRSAHVGARLGDARAGETLARLTGELDCAFGRDALAEINGS